jgi:hypothetical protein
VVNASQSVLPQLVRAEQLPEANGNQYAVQTIGQEFVGPPLGSLLFTAAAAVPFGVSAASFAGSAALLARLPKRPPETVPDGTVRSGSRRRRTDEGHVHGLADGGQDLGGRRAGQDHHGAGTTSHRLDRSRQEPRRRAPRRRAPRRRRGR